MIKTIGLLQALRLVAAVAATQCQVVAGNELVSPTGSLINRLQNVGLEQVTRFNYMDRGPGQITDRDLQYRIRARLQLNLTGDGSTYLRLRAETGAGFANSFENTGIGRGEPRWSFYLKSLALGQKLGSHVELQTGGIEFDSGAGSEHTYASGDGSLVGHRVVWKGGVRKISLTAGYVGDFEEPNVFSRFHPGKLNYTQALVQQHFGEDAEASVEVDLIRKIWFTRQTFRLRNAWRPVVDDILVEAVTRASANPSFGWSGTISRAFDRAGRWTGRAIYSHIPLPLYDKQGERILFNRGEIDVGKRIACSGAYSVGDLEIGAFAGRLLDATPSKRWVAQLFVRYDYARLIQRLMR